MWSFSHQANCIFFFFVSWLMIRRSIGRSISANENWGNFCFERKFGSHCLTVVARTWLEVYFEYGARCSYLAAAHSTYIPKVNTSSHARNVSALLLSLYTGFRDPKLRSWERFARNVSQRIVSLLQRTLTYFVWKYIRQLWWIYFQTGVKLSFRNQRTLPSTAVGLVPVPVGSWLVFPSTVILWTPSYSITLNKLTGSSFLRTAKCTSPCRLRVQVALSHTSAAAQAHFQMSSWQFLVAMPSHWRSAGLFSFPQSATR